MRRATFAALSTVLVLATLGDAGPLPVQIARARYVALGYDLGDHFLSEVEAIGNPDRVHPNDVAALANLRDQLESWGQYVVTTRPRDAELFFAVRTGRRVGLGGGGRVAGAGGNGGPTATGPMFRVELSSADDMLSIYESSGGGAGALLWRQRQSVGGAYPGKLLEQLKREVTAAPPPKKP